MKRISVRIPEELWRELKEYCAYHGYSLNQVILNHLWETVGKLEKHKRKGGTT